MKIVIIYIIINLYSYISLSLYICLCNLFLNSLLLSYFHDNFITLFLISHSL